MSKFSRAYEAAIKYADISQAAAAAKAGLDGSLVSRVLSGATALKTKHVAALLRALDSIDDRAHCLRCYLTDCAPEEYRDQLNITLGTALKEPRASRGADDLSKDLAALEKLAENDDALQDLLHKLVEVLNGK